MDLILFVYFMFTLINSISVIVKRILVDFKGVLVALISFYLANSHFCRVFPEVHGHWVI